MSDFMNKLNAALQDTVAEYNDCRDPSKAVAKVACAYGFEPPATKRLLETFNRARTIYHFETSMDKTAEFKLADMKEVFDYMHVSPKKASPSMSKIATAILKHQHYNSNINPFEQPPKVKEADASGLTRDQVLRKVATSYQELKNLYEEGRVLFTVCSNNIDDLMTKVANSLHRDSIDDKATMYKIDMLKEACNRDGIGDISVLLNRYLPDHLLGNRETKFAKVLDTTLVDTPLRHIRSVKTNLENIAKVSAFNEVIQNEIAEHYGNIDKIYKESSEEGPIDIGSLFNKNAQVFREVDKATSAVISHSARQEDKDKARKKLVNTHRRIMLEELIATDPVLAKQDPSDIVEAYQSIVSIAPDAANNKAVVASMLRQATMGTDGAMSPYDAGQLAKLNSAIKNRDKPAPYKDD